MTIDEAIKHCLEVAEDNETKAQKIGVQFLGTTKDKEATDCRECAADYRQLAEWLTELKELSLQIEAPRLGSIEEYHYELAKCKTAFWSCNKRCMDAEEQYRRKADELRKAQEQIAEYKRLLKAAKGIIKDVDCNEDYLCDECEYRAKCDGGFSFYWHYADEALKLIGEDGGNDETITGS